MKVLLSAAAAAWLIEASSGQSIYDLALRELPGCHLAFGACWCDKPATAPSFRPLGIVAAKTAAECSARGSTNYKWNMPYATASALQTASDAMPASSPLLVRLADGKTVKDLQSSLSGTGATASEFVFCPGGSTWAVLDKPVTSSALEGSIRLTTALKTHPLYLSASTEGAGVRVVARLGAAYRADAGAVMSAWRSRLTSAQRQSVQMQTGSLRTEAARGVTSSEYVVLSAAAAEDLSWVADAPEATWVGPSFDKQLFNFDAAQNVQSGYLAPSIEKSSLDQSANTPLWSKGITGKGQIVGIADSGLDMQSCLFADMNQNEVALQQARVSAGNETSHQYPTHRKIAQYFAYADGREGETGGHGTHVAGSVAGSVDAKYATAKVTVGGVSTPIQQHHGMAPDARIAFADIGIVNGGLVVPDDMSIILKPSYDIGRYVCPGCIWL
jgi:subtilisin family serine protease